MNKHINLLIKAVIFTLPIIICLYTQNVFAEAKREIEIKVIRQAENEIISESNHLKISI